MKRFVWFCIAIAISMAIYESIQWFRPTDYGLAADRWFAMATGGLIWQTGGWSRL